MDAQDFWDAAVLRLLTLGKSNEESVKEADALLLLRDARLKLTPDSYNLVLTSEGANRIQVIKAIRELTGDGLAVAKGKTENLPKLVSEGLDLARANVAQQVLMSVGARANVIPVYPGRGAVDFLTHLETV